MPVDQRADAARRGGRLLDVGVDHVTVTINTLDAEIAAQIYARLWLDGERYSGREAGEILIARQLEGVRRLTARGACW